MAFGYKWKPSKSAKREFAKTMKEIDDFVVKNGISQSKNGDSYYFTINDQPYRVSNHSIEASDKGMFDSLGNKVRESYHPNGRDKDTKYIHASKTRIMDIYNDLVNGWELDGHGNRTGNKATKNVDELIDTKFRDL